MVAQRTSGRQTRPTSKKRTSQQASLIVEDVSTIYIRSILYANLLYSQGNMSFSKRRSPSPSGSNYEHLLEPQNDTDAELFGNDTTESQSQGEASQTSTTIDCTDLPAEQPAGLTSDTYSALASQSSSRSFAPFSLPRAGLSSRRARGKTSWTHKHGYLAQFEGKIHWYCSLCMFQPKPWPCYILIYNRPDQRQRPLQCHQWY